MFSASQIQRITVLPLTNRIWDLKCCMIFEISVARSDDKADQQCKISMLKYLTR